MMKVPYGIIPEYSCEIFCIACIILLILVCMAAGYNFNQTPSVSATPPAVIGIGNTNAIKDFAFDPLPMTVKDGAIVTWANRDISPHTFFSDTGSPAILPFSFTLNRNILYLYDDSAANEHISLLESRSIKGMVIAPL